MGTCYHFCDSLLLRLKLGGASLLEIYQQGKLTKSPVTSTFFTMRTFVIFGLVIASAIFLVNAGDYDDHDGKTCSTDETTNSTKTGLTKNEAKEACKKDELCKA